MRSQPMVSALALAALAAGCQQEFRPLSDRTSMRFGVEAADYDLKVDGEDVGDARVRSTGAPHEDLPEVPGDVERLIEVGLRIRNDSDAPMRLDLSGTELEIRTEDDRLFIVDKPVRRPPVPEVAPHSTERFALIFALPPGIQLGDVAGYELLWAVQTEAGRVSRTTTFVKDHLGGYPGYYRPYYGGLGYGLGYYPGFSYGLYPGIGSGWYGYYW